MATYKDEILEKELDDLLNQALYSDELIKLSIEAYERCLARHGVIGGGDDN